MLLESLKPFQSPNMEVSGNDAIVSDFFFRTEANPISIFPLRITEINIVLFGTTLPV